MTWILPFFDPCYHCDMMHQKSIHYIHIHYTSLYHDSYMLHTQSPLHSMNSIRLPLAAPNHHAICFFGADTFEPRSDGAVALSVSTGGREEPPPRFLWSGGWRWYLWRITKFSKSTGTYWQEQYVMSIDSRLDLDHNIQYASNIF